jgi:hypothetical protein
MSLTVSYTGSGTAGVYVIPFPYLLRTHISCRVNGVLTNNLVWQATDRVQVIPTPGATDVVTFERVTPSAPIVTFTDDARFDKRNLDASLRQSRFIAEEAVRLTQDIADEVFQSAEDASDNAALAVSSRDAAAASATAAAGSATAAATTAAGLAASVAASATAAATSVDDAAFIAAAIEATVEASVNAAAASAVEAADIAAAIEATVLDSVAAAAASAADAEATAASIATITAANAGAAATSAAQALANANTAVNAAGTAQTAAESAASSAASAASRETAATTAAGNASAAAGTATGAATTAVNAAGAAAASATAAASTAAAIEASVALSVAAAADSADAAAISATATATAVGVAAAAASSASADAAAAATSAELLSETYDAVGYLDPQSLFVWMDGANRSVGAISREAQWKIFQDMIRTPGFEILDYPMIGSKSPIIVVDAANKVLWQAPEGDDGDNIEVNVARGTAVDLNTRLSRSMSPAGTPLDVSFGKTKMRNTQWKLTARKLAENAQLNIAFVGDSFTQNPNRWSGPVAQLLIAEYGDGGGGWTGYSHRGTGTATWTIGVTQPNLRNGNARPSLYGMSLGGTWTRVSNASDSPDLDHITSSEVGARVQRTVPATPDHTALRVVFIGTSNGVVQHRVDGGAWTQVNVQGTVGALQTFDIPLTPGAHTIDIDVVSGTVTLCGDNALSSAPGVRVHKLGAAGSDIAEWAVRDETNQRAAFAMLNLDAYIIMDGTNSGLGGIPGPTWYGHMVTMVNRFRAASPGCDVAIVMPPDNQDPDMQVPMPVYAGHGREIAFELSTAYLNLQDAFGDDPADYGSGSARPLFNADLVHPEPLTGGRRMVAEIMAFLKPF